MSDMRVIRDDGATFATLEAAGVSAYGKPRHGTGIAHAINTGGTAGGHRWRYSDDYEAAREARDDTYWSRWSYDELTKLATMWPAHGGGWELWPEALPGRTARAIREQAKRMGLKTRARRNGWTASEDRLVLKALLDVASKTGRAPGAVLARMNALRARAREAARESARKETSDE